MINKYTSGSHRQKSSLLATAVCCPHAVLLPRAMRDMILFLAICSSGCFAAIEEHGTFLCDTPEKFLKPLEKAAQQQSDLQNHSDCISFFDTSVQVANSTDQHIALLTKNEADPIKPGEKMVNSTDLAAVWCAILE